MRDDAEDPSFSEARPPPRVQPRPSWPDFFMEIVQTVRKRSQSQKLQVGYLLVVQNRIVSQGYNSFLPSCPHEPWNRDGREINVVHAEQNALADCAKRG
jgi:dCMP deaminase